MSYTPVASEVAARAWVVEVLDGTPPSASIIYDGQDAPRPASPFVALSVVLDEELGQAGTDLRTIVGGAQERAEQDRVITLRVTAYGQTARTICDRLTHRSSLPGLRQRALELGLGILDVQAARRVPAFLAQVTEDRWVVEIRIHTIAIATRSELGTAQVSVTAEVT